MTSTPTSRPQAFALAAAALLFGAWIWTDVQHPVAAEDETASIERGRYLVAIAGCNDCHTPGFGASGGKVPEQAWLTGDQVGFRGPWGTTYPTNLRLLLQDRSEEDWVAEAEHLQTRPPMPWWALNVMTETDRRAIYRFMRSLGPAGVPAPEFMPPGEEPSTPFISWPEQPK